MLPLTTIGRIEGQRGVRLWKAVGRDAPGHWPTETCAMLAPSDGDGLPNIVEEARGRGYGGIIVRGRAPRPPSWTRAWITHEGLPGLIAEGDVIRAVGGLGFIRVLYRRGANSNSLFATERCNSYCLMCSQPPREVDDSSVVAELRQLITLIDHDEPMLGITGGEPTLLGSALTQIIRDCSEHLPATGLWVLTNGRRFEDLQFVSELAAVRHPSLLWAVPLYADCPPIHDYVVQVRGAFDETVRGLCNLARLRQRIEIRVVIHRQTVPRLSALAYFLARNFPFVAHVALMGLEPTGFAKANMDLLWQDPREYAEYLSEAVSHLATYGIPVSLYNFQRCVLPESLWPFARRSISDWKNWFPAACDTCAMRHECCGFFASARAEARFHEWTRPFEARDSGG